VLTVIIQGLKTKASELEHEESHDNWRSKASNSMCLDTSNDNCPLPAINRESINCIFC
jgi:hypothetical protein